MFWDARHEGKTLINLRGQGSALPLSTCAFRVRWLGNTLDSSTISIRDTGNMVWSITTFRNPGCDRSPVHTSDAEHQRLNTAMRAVAESRWPDSKVWTLQRRRWSLPAYELKLPWVAMTSVIFVGLRGWVKMTDSSSDDDVLRLLQILTIAVAMQMRRKKKKAQRRFYTRSINTQRK